MSLFATPYLSQNTLTPNITLTGNVAIDLVTLRKLNKTTLLKLCESDAYILNLCNNDTTLYKIITAPDV